MPPDPAPPDPAEVAFLFDGPEAAPVTILLAHGAGGPMDTASMTAAAGALASAGFRVARFEFDYMAARRSTGRRWPPPRAETLVPQFRAAIDALAPPRPPLTQPPLAQPSLQSRLARPTLTPPTTLVIGGKSMGGRVASLAADALHAEGRAAGVLCLGYPFHPPDRPDQLRTAHLATLATPTLIVQGTRDPFGTREDVAGYTLSPRIRIHWLEDGDHDLKPRKRISGLTAADHLDTMAQAVAAWIRRIA